MNREMVLEMYCGNEMRRLKRICFPMISKIGGLYECDYDDFYSIANAVIEECVNSFDETMNDNFEGYLIGCLKNKFKSEMTRRNRKRRIPSKDIDRLDRKCSDDNDLTLGEVLPGKYKVENEIPELREEDAVYRYIQALSPKQKKIAHLILDGYSLTEIENILGIEEKKFNRMLEKMRTFEKRVLLNPYN